jgi:hypothetical protein
MQRFSKELFYFRKRNKEKRRQRGDQCAQMYVRHLYSALTKSLQVLMLTAIHVSSG